MALVVENWERDPGGDRCLHPDGLSDYLGVFATHSARTESPRRAAITRRPRKDRTIPLR